MASIRKRLAVNANDSKNTRMDIASAGTLANWRPDELAHISRFCKMGQLIMDRAKTLGRPVDILEIGCGEVWTLRYLYKAFVTRKAEIVNSYVGMDIDPACLNDWWVDDELPLTEHKWFQTMSGGKGQIILQDLTTNPEPPVEDESIDVFMTTEVIEHMGREFIEPWIEASARKLRSGGIAYISTPNHDGSNDKLPEDHVYEWGYEELKELLEKHFVLEKHYGTFTQTNNFNHNHRANLRWPQHVVDDIKNRFDKHWQRVILATAYPETSNNVNWQLRKK